VATPKKELKMFWKYLLAAVAIALFSRFVLTGAIPDFIVEKFGISGDYRLTIRIISSILFCIFGCVIIYYYKSKQSKNL